MGYIDEALQAGYKAKEVIETLMTANPEFAKRVTAALAAGYGFEDVLKSVASSFRGKPSRKVAKSMGVNPRYAKNLALSSEIDTATLIAESMRPRSPRAQSQTLGGIGGAALGGLGGGLLGGPVGALQGAIGGGVAGSNLADAEGFGDVIGAGVKGASAAYAAGKVPAALAAVSGILDREKQLQQQPEQPLGQAQITVQETPSAQEPVQEPEVQVLDKSNAYEAISRTGRISIFDAMASQLGDVESIKGYWATTFGKKALRNIEKETGLTADEAFQQAIEYVQEREGQGTAPEEAQQPQDAVVEEAVFENVYHGSPQAPIVEEAKAQAELVKPENVTQKQGKLGTQSDVKPLYMLDGDESFVADVWHNTFDPDKIERKPGQVKERVKPLKMALKSSNVRGARFNPDSGRMRVVFGAKKGRKGGTVYEYENVDLDTFQKMVGGEARPITEGSNEYGIWFNEKDPSVGAAFAKHIRSNPEDFPYTPIEESGQTVPEKQIIQSDRAFQASRLFEPFESMRERGRQVVTGKAIKERLKLTMPVIKQMDDEFMADLVAYIEEEIGLKNPPTLTRLEKEVKKRF